MNTQDQSSILEQCRNRLWDIVAAHNLNDVELQIRVKALTPEEAIGTPSRRDFPIIEGRERMIEASVLGARGQAFTDSPAEFTGSIRTVLGFQFTTNRTRALFVATLNAVLRHLNLVEGTVHCKDEDPETCALEIAAIARKSGANSVGLIGLNPAIAEALVREFGAAAVRISDLDGNNIGRHKFDVEIQDGRTMAEEIVKASDMVLITGTTLVNGTFDGLWKLVNQNGRKVLIYGVTASGVNRLMNLPRVCPCARD